MTEYINMSHWAQSLAKPDWYIILDSDFSRLEEIAAKEKDPAKRKLIKKEAYEAVENALRVSRIPLAQSGPNLDKERKQVDTIVIHHTKNPAGMTLDRLNAMQLIRIYGRYFANPTIVSEKSLKGKPIWSGHFYNGQQVFWGYHWLIRENGVKEHILKDDYVGWHAGNWGINTSSIAICIDDDLSEKEPSNTVISSIADLINRRYSHVLRSKIIGHLDVNAQTECPGYLFHNSWQNKLLHKIN